MKSCRRGFTLVEVIVAVLLVSILLTGVYGVFEAVSSARDRLDEEGIIYHQARIFFDRLGNELSSLRLSSFDRGAVFEGGSTVYGTPYLEFNTEVSSPLQPRHGGITRVRYEVQDNEGALTLYRSEQPLLVDVATSEQLLFIEGLQQVEIRYYGQGAWHERWMMDNPPQLVEVTFEFDNDIGAAIPFRSSFVLSGGRG